MSVPSLNLRLRSRKEFVLNGTWMMSNQPDLDCTEAADRIANLEAALREIVEHDDNDCGDARAMRIIARVALAECQLFNLTK